MQRKKRERAYIRNYINDFHLQIDGQTEHINNLFEIYLRYYVSAH